METHPGRRCARLLVAMALPQRTMVQCLMGELGLTYDEAETALFTARAKQFQSHIATR